MLYRTLPSLGLSPTIYLLILLIYLSIYICLILNRICIFNFQTFICTLERRQEISLGLNITITAHNLYLPKYFLKQLSHLIPVGVSRDIKFLEITFHHCIIRIPETDRSSPNKPSPSWGAVTHASEVRIISGAFWFPHDIFCHRWVSNK